MLAIYARQSVDRADSISIENQIEFCKYEAKGEAFNTYVDRGYSGKNTNRPEFQRLLSDINDNKISAVIVYKLDRISRSILDFATMMNNFAKHHVKFISATEKFDTSTPMGNAMLNICIVFAQLERETIQKRVADAYFSRSLKGFYMGGRIPYGFRKIPMVIDGIHTSKYEQIPEEVAQIKMIYSMYAEQQCSYGDIVREFERMGITKNGRPWARTRLHEIIRNPIYVKADLDIYNFFKNQGVQIQNPPSDFIGENGCYYYKGKNASRLKYTDMKDSNLVLAPHTGIIDSDIWLKCREKSLSRKQIVPTQKAKNTWLAGKIKCGKCGYALVAKVYKNRNAKYLMCSNRMNNGKCEGAGMIKTPEMEAFIFQEMRKKLSEFKVLTNCESTSQNSELSRLSLEKVQLQNEIESLLNKVSKADDVLLKYINEKVTALDQRKKDIEKRMIEFEKPRNTEVSEMQNYLDSWDDLPFESKRMVVNALIDRIEATNEKIKIIWEI